MNNLYESSTPLNGETSNPDHRDGPPTSELPKSETAPSAADDVLNRVVQGAHNTIDRLAGKAHPTVRQWTEKMANAESAVQAKTDQLVESQQVWTESMRKTVRTNPVLAVAAAIAVGALIARIAR